MFTNSKLLNDAEGNENLNKIMMAIESLPEDTKKHLQELFKHAPLFIFQAMQLKEMKKER
jgi:hypothetical protein